MGFAAGTQILMADGSLRAIEKINKGDVVLSFDQLDAFGKLEPKRVVDTFMRIDRNPLKVKIKNSEVELTVAPGQLFIDPGHDWKEATKINEIIDGAGNVHEFEVAQITRGKHQMFDIIVEDNHSLIANGVRVHNMSYTVADVIAGRYVPANTLPGAIRRFAGDLDNTNESYGSGNRKKKKGKKKRTSTPEVRVDGLVTSTRFLGNIESLVDSVSEIIEETTPSNLTAIKVTIQSSVDSLIDYVANLTANVLNATMSSYDKSEVLSMTVEMSAAATALRDPFEETVVSASGKLAAINQLNIMKLLILRIKNAMDLYTVAPPAKETPSSNLSTNKKAFKSTRAVNGKYGVQNNSPFAYRSEGGGSRGGGNDGAKTGPSRSSNSNTPGGNPRPTGGQNPSPSKSPSPNSKSPNSASSNTATKGSTTASRDAAYGGPSKGGYGKTDTKNI